MYVFVYCVLLINAIVLIIVKIIEINKFEEILGKCMIGTRKSTFNIFIVTYDINMR